LRPSELWLVSAVALAAVIAAVIGQHAAPRASLRDTRLSTLLDGPLGAKGLADALGKLGMGVEARQRPWFDWNNQRSGADSLALLALLDVTVSLTEVEERVIRNHVALGNALLLAGQTGVERCFGYGVSPFRGWAADTSRPIVLPPGIDFLPEARAFVAEIPFDSLIRSGPFAGEECPVLFPSRVDTLLRTEGDHPVVVRLSFRSGGLVTLVADSRLLSNEALRETDAGLLVIAWTLFSDPDLMVVDEFHHGFHARRSILMVAWSWARTSPLGWTILQLVAAAIIALGFMSVRFGPALRVVERRRRSALEHLEALAAGLERAAGDDEAVNLFVTGLARRLGRRTALTAGQAEWNGWLSALELSVRTADERDRVRRLASLIGGHGGRERVLDTALAVEALWEALGKQKKLRPS